MPVASAVEGGALPQALDLPSRSLRDSPALSVTLHSGLYCPAPRLRRGDKVAPIPRDATAVLVDAVEPDTCP